jgi:hypothetical protein
MMRTRFVAVVATAALLAGFGSAALAETKDDMSFSGMANMDHVDRNKDGMVSKAEFLEMMGKVYDMKAKQMKVKGDKMTPADFQQILMYFKAGS